MAINFQDKSSLVIAQISDCHLFADKAALHCGVNVYQNLLAVFNDIKADKDIELIIFTGDLTQDHSVQSYQLFVEAFVSSQLTLPVYFTSGNHDDPALLNRYLTQAPFCGDKLIETKNWQLIMLNSKSDTPAGKVKKQQLAVLSKVINKDKFQLVFMHHHAIPVGYFIDKHGLKNSESFWQVIDKFDSIKAIACGHVHRALTLLPEVTQKSTVLYTCPATSIQFDPQADTVKALPQGAGYRLFYLEPPLTKNQAGIKTTVRFLTNQCDDGQ